MNVFAQYVHFCPFFGHISPSFLTPEDISVYKGLAFNPLISLVSSAMLFYYI